MVWAALVLLVVAFGAGLVAVQRRRRCGGWHETLGPPTRREGLIAGSAAAALLGTVALAAALLRPDADCRNREYAETRRGQLRAVLFERNCGATAGFSTHVALVGAGDPLPETGNVFIADTGHGRAPAAIGGGPWAGVRWAQADLAVRYDERARVSRRVDHVAGTRIRFETAPAAGIDAALPGSDNR